jgi:imidazole glycerol-phosphate synthase subunit HisF
MRRTRVIPVLLLSGGGVVKGKRFENYTYIGDPINAARLFSDLEVDEIIVIDIDATRDGRPPDLDMIRNLSSEALMPFCYGGGITSAAQVGEILRCGIEKVVINRAVQHDLSLISECSVEFGSQSIAVGIDYSNSFFGRTKQYDHIKRKRLTVDVVDSAIQAADAGAGEVMLTSVDRDGLMSGMDVSILSQVSSRISIPLIASGGAGSLEHIKEAERSGAAAVAGGSMFVFHGEQRGVLINYPTKEQLGKYLC